MTDSSTDDRVHGIDFGDLDDRLDELDYPVSAADLVDAFGDQTLGLESGQVTLADALEPMGSQTFASSDEVRETLAAAVGEDAVGRTEYTDRGSGTTADSDVSF